MPKLKTKKAATKRFKVTKGGKVKKKQPFTSHILTKKSRKRKRKLKRPSTLHPIEQKAVKKMLPYV